MFSNRFNTRNDPLLEAAEAAMRDGDLRRQAEGIVNEAFGVYNRKAVVNEHLADYDAAIEEVYAGLKEGVLDSIGNYLKNPTSTQKAVQGAAQGAADRATGGMLGKLGSALSVGGSSAAPTGQTKNIRESKTNDGNLANNYPPYDKVTRGDVIAGRLGKDQMGGKRKNMKEEEQIDEISNKVKGAYLGSAVADLTARSKHYGGIDVADQVSKFGRGLARKIKNRQIGIANATKDIREEEQLDELKRSTLTSYIRKAARAKATPENISKRSKGLGLAAKKLEKIDEAMSHGARELSLYADNHAGLHRSSHQPIVKNLSRKHAKGSYDHSKAEKLWGYHAKRASDAYHKEFGHKFSVAERREAAKHMADSARDEHGFGSVKEDRLDELYGKGKLPEIRRKHAGDYVTYKARADFHNRQTDKADDEGNNDKWEHHFGKAVDYQRSADIAGAKSKRASALMDRQNASDAIKTAKSKSKESKKEYKSFGEDTQLDEISKRTLGSYVKKASHDVATRSAETRGAAMKADQAREKQDYMGARRHEERSNKMFKKSWKRREGMAKAVDRLTKEDIQLDELSAFGREFAAARAAGKSQFMSKVTGKMTTTALKSPSSAASKPTGSSAIGGVNPGISTRQAAQGTTIKQSGGFSTDAPKPSASNYPDRGNVATGKTFAAIDKATNAAADKAATARVKAAVAGTDYAVPTINAPTTPVKKYAPSPAQQQAASDARNIRAGNSGVTNPTTTGSTGVKFAGTDAVSAPAGSAADMYGSRSIGGPRSSIPSGPTGERSTGQANITASAPAAPKPAVKPLVKGNVSECVQIGDTKYRIV